MDSKPETYKHIHEVQKNMLLVTEDLQERSIRHDESKLQSPEVEYFDKYTELLKSVEYGSKEYQECLDNLKPALDHHYKYNRHHPEFHKKGIQGMSLIDLIEMLCDWQAATKRCKNGNIYISIEKNQERFKYSDELKQTLINTAKDLGF
jgi:hypothetical protein